MIIPSAFRKALLTNFVIFQFIEFQEYSKFSKGFVTNEWFRLEDLSNSLNSRAKEIRTLKIIDEMEFTANLSDDERE
jgi:hypothetical protein